MPPALIEFDKPTEVAIKRGRQELTERKVEVVVLSVNDAMEILRGEMKTTFAVKRRGWFGRESLGVRQDYVQDSSLIKVDGPRRVFAAEVWVSTNRLEREESGGYLHGGIRFKLGYAK